MRSKPPLAPKAAAAERLLAPEVVKAIRQAGGKFDSESLLTAILEHWGGVDAFAHDVVKEYTYAAEGTLLRQRIMELVTRLFVKVDDQQKALDKRRPTAEMSDEELESTAMSILKGMTDQAIDVEAADG